MAAVNLPGLQPAADLVQQQQQQVAAVAAPNTDNPQKLSGAANNQAVTGLTPNSNSQRFKFVIIGEPSGNSSFCIQFNSNLVSHYMPFYFISCSRIWFRITSELELHVLF